MRPGSYARMNVSIQNDHLYLKLLFNFIILTYLKFNKKLLFFN
jgi:hypothetical protein